MNISAMLEREPFYDVLFETTRRYFLQVHGVAVNVGFYKKADCKKLYLYRLLSFVSSKKITKGMKEFLCSEYNIRGNILKYFIGKLCIFAVTALHGLAADKCFYIGPEKTVNAPIFILPCNRSIRYYDFENDYVDCIVKEGYKADFMENQLSFRLSNNYFFIPKVVEYGYRWYRERIMHGNPLARIRNKAAYKKGTADALAYMGIIAKDTIQYIGCGEYIRNLCDNVESMLVDFIKSGASGGGVLAEFIKCAACGAEHGDFDVPTVLSHGDLQSGNIWITERGDTIIYDWETNCRRSIWYDPATLLWQLHSGTLAPDIHVRVRNDKRFLINDEKKDYSEKQLSAVAWIIILENVTFYLTDILQLPLQFGKQSFEQLAGKLHKQMEMRITDGT
ncbi:MAG: phosphotransferase [Oscillospiraceae bacterium]|nr:phosphotransferase [Oscillospiraceae bacterium]